MPMPSEKVRAIDTARDLLYTLLDTRLGVPPEIRERARVILQDYPTPYYTEELHVPRR